MLGCRDFHDFVMSWVILTLIVGAVNLALGYTLAVQMGCGPHTLTEAWEILIGRVPARFSHDASVDALIQALATQSESKKAEAEAKSPETMLRELVAGFQPDLLKNEANLIQVDTDVRTTVPATAETVAAQSQALQANCEAYLADLGKTSTQLQSQFAGLGKLKPLGEQIDMALVEQSAQVDATVRNLSQWDPTEEPTVAAEQLKEETVSLLSTIHQLRDFLMKAFLTIVRQDLRRPKIETAQTIDLLTGTPNRIGLELTLQEWWEQNRFRDQANCAILFDLDSFLEVNRQFGVAAGKHVLRTVVERMRESLGPNDAIFRYSGQQIAILLGGVESAAGLQTARRISETVQTKPILYETASISVSITGTVVPILAKSTPADILARLVEELGTAKRIMRGKVYLSDKAKAPAPVFDKGQPAQPF